MMSLVPSFLLQGDTTSKALRDLDTKHQYQNVAFQSPSATSKSGSNANKQSRGTSTATKQVKDSSTASTATKQGKEPSTVKVKEPHTAIKLDKEPRSNGCCSAILYSGVGT